MAGKKAPTLPYSFESLPGEDQFLLNLYRPGGRGKDQVVVTSPEGIKGLDSIAAYIREDLRSKRVAAAAEAHDLTPQPGGLKREQ